jgi:hypothetical protein
MLERNILRRIFGAVKENGVWTICTNQMLMKLYREPDIISEMIKTVRTCGKNVRRKKLKVF